MHAWLEMILQRFLLYSELGQHVRAEAEARVLPPPPSAHLNGFSTPRLVSVHNQSPRFEGANPVEQALLPQEWR